MLVLVLVVSSVGVTSVIAGSVCVRNLVLVKTLTMRMDTHLVVE